MPSREALPRATATGSCALPSAGAGSGTTGGPAAYVGLLMLVSPVRSGLGARMVRLRSREGSRSAPQATSAPLPRDPSRVATRTVGGVFSPGEG
ncbi:hypothetical protein ALMP_76350 [Streptomyces sp. A012304]|nr:hypothetical protein ALMP_76350 [Streptomyces sp. A012304]